jgi:sec-independent protein translocase protein TatA
MGSFSIWHWVIVALVVLLLFGRGRISEMMGDLAKGIKSFKKGLAEDDASSAPAQRGAAQPSLPREAPPAPATPAPADAASQPASRDAA